MSSDKQDSEVSDFLSFFADNLERVISGECKRVEIRCDAYESAQVMVGVEAAQSICLQLQLLRDAFRPGSTVSTMTWFFEL